MTDQPEVPAGDEIDLDDLDGIDDPSAPDNADEVELDPDHVGDETDPPRDAADADDDLSDVPEGEIVSAAELSD